jgi:hypothetical protein
MQSGFRYVDFLCRKDPSMTDETGGYCELCDRVGADASEKFVALAVELDVVKDGKRVTAVTVAEDTWVDKETGEDRSKPRWGLVIQAAKNFYSYFAAYHENTGDIREVPWEIYREGAGTDTKYHSFELKAQLPDLSQLDIPSLMELLEEMGSDEKYSEVEKLSPGSQKSFGNSNKPQTDSGVIPDGNRESEFERVKRELEGTVKTPVESY